MKLSILVPVYNEDETIIQVVEELMWVKLSWEKEIIIIDDGSTDGTGYKIKEALKHLGWWRRHQTFDSSKVKKTIKVISHPKNLGKGAAVRSGIKKATGDYILIQDADREYKPREIPKLLAALKGKTGKIAVYGTRFKEGTAVIPLLYRLGNYFLTWMTNMLYGTHLTDMETGYKLIPAALIKQNPLVSNGFDFEPEVTILMVKNNIQIIEVPITYSGRSHLAGKKLTVKDALASLFVLLSPINLWPI